MVKRLGPGEKIRRLRLAMGLTQDDLTNDELSKSIVSMIESNKRNLTWNTARIIADCLNVYYEGIGKKITAEYLMETEEEEAKRIIKEDLDHLQKAINNGNVDEQLVENTFEKIIGLINEWGLQKEKAELQIIRGDFYYRGYRYNEALKEYLDVLDYSLQTQDHSTVGRMYSSIGNVYQMQMAIDSALVHYLKAYDTARVHQPEDKEKRKAFSVYNQILCYRKLKRYDLALSHISMFNELEWNDPQYKTLADKILLLEGNTYRDINNFDKALKIYGKILNDEKKLDKETLFLLFDNFGELYLQKREPKEALLYIKKAVSLKHDVNVNYVPGLYLKEAKCYNLLEEYDVVSSLLENGLRLAEKVAKQEFIIEMHFSFVDLYVRTRDFDTALVHLETIEKLMADKDINIYKYDLYSFYCDVYLGLGEKEKVSKYLSKIRKNYLTN